jgi:hypothetical protein
MGLSPHGIGGLVPILGVVPGGLTLLLLLCMGLLCMGLLCMGLLCMGHYHMPDDQKHCEDSHFA